MDNTNTNTIATPANMKLAAKAHPWGGVVAASVNNPLEHYSATPGDYWADADDVPVTDNNGEPCVLVVAQTRYIDALTGAQL